MSTFYVRLAIEADDIKDVTDTIYCSGLKFRDVKVWPVDNREPHDLTKREIVAYFR